MIIASSKVKEEIMLEVNLQNRIKLKGRVEGLLNNCSESKEKWTVSSSEENIDVLLILDLDLTWPKRLTMYVLFKIF